MGDCYRVRGGNENFGADGRRQLNDDSCVICGRGLSWEGKGTKFGGNRRRRGEDEHSMVEAIL